MNYRTLGKTGYSVSAVVYGGIVSSSEHGAYAPFSDGQSASDYYVSYAIDRGVNYFDVAPTYGDAEILMGNSLRPYRKDVHLACKTILRTRAEAEREMRTTMERLHTDWFDTYQLHALSTMEDLEIAFGPGGVMELLVEMKEKGIARRLGITSHSEDVVLRAIELFDFDSILFPVNWHMHMAHGMGERLLHAAKEKNIGVLGMKSMIECAWGGADGALRQKYPKSWCKPIDADTEPELLIAAIKYALSRGVDVIVPPGNFIHFKFAVDNIEKILEPLSEQETELLKDRLAAVKDRPFFDV